MAFAPATSADLERARRYDRWFESRWGAYAFGVERAALLAAAGELAGQRVLDVGCGTGRFTAALEARGACVTGVDVDPAALAVARTRVAGALTLADAHTLPFADQAFDVVVSVTATEFLTDPPTALAEALRVTRTDGRVVLAALNPRSPWGLAHRRRLRDDDAWAQACLRTPHDLADLLPGEVRAERQAALYAPGAIPGLERVGPALERLGRRLAPDLGAFQVLTLPRSAQP